MRNTCQILLFLFTLSGCVRSEFSPSQKFDHKTPYNINALNIKKLGEKPKPSGTKIRIAVSGDVQRVYKEAEDFVAHINDRNDIDFVILNGDIADFGLLMEFQWMNAIYSELKVPFISVIGNHDLVANGQDVYKHLFGPLNFTFNYAGIKFICHDTNGREYNFNGKIPDLNWLKEQLKPSQDHQHVVAFSHVPPTDNDFDVNLREEYEHLLDTTPGVIASIHSHQHSPDVIYSNDGGIPFIITNGVINRAFTIVEIENGEINAQAVKF